MKVLKVFGKLIAALLTLIGATFAVYWFNLDMKLVRKFYDVMQPHYDDLEKDKKL